MLSYVKAVAIGFDVFVNAVIGGREYQTISSRIGESIKANGWAAHVPWPAFFKAHCLASDYTAEV